MGKMNTPERQLRSCIWADTDSRREVVKKTVKDAIKNAASRLNKKRLDPTPNA